MNSPEMADQQVTTPDKESFTVHDSAIAARAHEKWMARDRVAGANLQDWLEAEAELIRAYFGADNDAAQCLIAEHAVTRILAESAEIINAAPRIMQVICECLGWDLGLVWTVDEDSHVLRCIDVWQAPASEVSAFAQANRESTFAEGVGLPGHVWRSLCPAWIPDVTQDDNFTRVALAIRDGLHGAYGFPISDGVEFLGVMEFFSRQMLLADKQLLDMMAAIGGEMAQFLGRRRAEQTVRERNHEFSLARRIQQGLQPKSMPVFPGFTFAAVSQSCQETGGDYYDFLSFVDSGVGIAIGDACGHGIGAALIMTETRALMHALVLDHTDPGTILALTNRCLVEDLAPEHFVTMFLARLDPGTRTLVYSNAGHPPGYVLDQLGKVRSILHSTGPPMGIEASMRFPTAPAITLLPGDILLLFTDGVTETCSPTESFFEIQRVLKVVRARRHEEPCEILGALYRAVGDFSGNQSPLDDVSAIIIKVGACAINPHSGDPIESRC